MGYFGIVWNFPSSLSEFPFQKFDELNLLVTETHHLRLCQDTGDGSFEIRRENHLRLVVEIPLFAGFGIHPSWDLGCLPSTVSTTAHVYIHGISPFQNKNHSSKKTTVKQSWTSEKSDVFNLL